MGWLAAFRPSLAGVAEMNSETSNLISVVIAVGGPIVGRWGIDSATWGSLVHQLAGDIPALVGAGMLIYSHWGMKKVPATAVVVTTGK
jgi:hypothetical protein